MRVDGACHCGKVTYRAEVDPEKSSLCNCTDCQTMSGAPFRWVVLSKEDTLEVLTGSPKTYIKTAESGRQRALGFCGDCGTQLYTTSVGPGPKVHSVRVGTLAQRGQLAPQRQLWTRSAQAWTGGIGALPCMEKS